MVKLEERQDVTPVCPHCDAELWRVWFQPITGVLGRRYLYFCPECRAALGVSHRKGFWMG